MGWERTIGNDHHHHHQINIIANKKKLSSLTWPIANILWTIKGNKFLEGDRYKIICNFFWMRVNRDEESFLLPCPRRNLFSFYGISRKSFSVWIGFGPCYAGWPFGAYNKMIYQLFYDHKQTAHDRLNLFETLPIIIGILIDQTFTDWRCCLCQ